VVDPVPCVCSKLTGHMSLGSVERARQLAAVSAVSEAARVAEVAIPSHWRWGTATVSMRGPPPRAGRAWSEPSMRACARSRNTWARIGERPLAVHVARAMLCEPPSQVVARRGVIFGEVLGEAVNARASHALWQRACRPSTPRDLPPGTRALPIRPGPSPAHRRSPGVDRSRRERRRAPDRRRDLRNPFVHRGIQTCSQAGSGSSRGRPRTTRCRGPREIDGLGARSGFSG
jgi:hypothetical protein